MNCLIQLLLRLIGMEKKEKKGDTLPTQSLQIFSSSLMPSQGLPPNTGAGSVHVLMRFAFPRQA